MFAGFRHMLCDILARAGDGQLHGAESVLGPSAKQLQLRRAEIEKRGKWVVVRHWSRVRVTRYLYVKKTCTNTSCCVCRCRNHSARPTGSRRRDGSLPEEMVSSL